ncbi:MAG TPA: aldo/keto reductase [Candidatus Dormibacteraeota bacterium]|nr:aldo/keto reductase [Candidatus Dormibacteraeota bacterium]
MLHARTVPPGFPGFPIGLGCYPMSEAFRPIDDAESTRAIHAAYDAGVRLFDTADAYGPNHNERLLGRALRRGRDAFVATKGGYVRPHGAWVPDGHPEHLRAACEGSLRRLGVERIDLYQLHAPDPDVPIEESVGALEELRTAGKIARIGLSNVGVEEIEAARAAAPIASVQNELNLSSQEDLRDVVPYCERTGILYIAYAPLHQGAFRLPQVRHLAKMNGVSPAAVVLAWLLGTSPAVLPIPGTQSADHARENAENAVRFALPERDMRELTTVAERR